MYPLVCIILPRPPMKRFKFFKYTVFKFILIHDNFEAFYLLGVGLLIMYPDYLHGWGQFYDSIWLFFVRFLIIWLLNITLLRII